MVMKKGIQFLLSMFIFSHLFYPRSVISLTSEPQYVNYNCQKTNNTYTSGSSFHMTLNDTLLLKLPEKASQDTFSTVTNGIDIDQINALFFCRANMGLVVCHTCVLAAAEKITEKCQNKKEAIVWFEECTLRYSNRSIFYIDEENPVHIHTNNSGVLNDYFLDPFKEKFNIAIAGVVKEAAYSKNLKGFATTQVNISSSEVLHCVVQCSRDVTGLPCERCLISAFNQRDKWADTMVFMPSCFIRVDLHRSSTLVSPPPPAPPVKNWPKVLTITIFASRVVGVAILAAAIYYFCRHSLVEGIEGLKVFTFSQLSAATGHFKKANSLGEGGFGEVYRGIIPRISKDIPVVAVKRLKRGTYHGNQEFLLEMRNNSRARHTNVVSLIGYCTTKADKLLVYEFMPRNCLHKNLHGDNATPEELTAEIRMKIALGTAKGLEYLHESNPKIIHRDIKSANILLDYDFEPKLADFGLAKIFPDDVSCVWTEVKGTESYLDPDYVDTKQLTEKSDVYSFGIVLLELITGLKSRWLFNTGRTLLQALSESRFADLIDPKLKIEDDQIEQIELTSVMTRLMICAALCIHPSSKCRLKMSQVVELLEAGALPAHNIAHIVTYAKSDPQSSMPSGTLELEDLRILAIEVHERWYRKPAEPSNVTDSSFISALSNLYMECQGI